MFSTNFESGRPAGLTGWDLEAMGSGNDGSFSSYGFSGSQWLRSSGGNSTATLTLTGLAAHTTVSLGFLMGLMDSFDSNDNFRVRIDGTTVYTMTWPTWGGGTPTAGTVLVANKQLAGTNGQPWSNDYGYDMSSLSALNNIAHTGTSLTIDFIAGFDEGKSNESIAIDNLTVTTNAGASAVPEPTDLSLIGLALLAAGLGRRRGFRAQF